MQLQRVHRDWSGRRFSTSWRELLKTIERLSRDSRQRAPG
jgi:hypothetical protein